MKHWTQLMLFAYLATLTWQIVWLAILTIPTGFQNIWLATVACVPLLIPLAGILKRQYRSLIWGGVVLLLYFIVGIMEIWTDPSHRWPATVQVLLVTVYILAFRKRNQINIEPTSP